MKLMVCFVATLAAAASAQVAPPPAQSAPATGGQSSVSAPEPLSLTCYGGGTANKHKFSSFYGFNSLGRSAFATGVTSTESGFEDQVDVRLFAGDDRIRLPRKMLPPAHGGSEGWFVFKDLRVSERDILGTAAVNFINNPKIRIDRVTGTINISGKAGDFVGQCRKFDPSAEKPKF